jgi:hypothetical protein
VGGVAGDVSDAAGGAVSGCLAGRLAEMATACVRHNKTPFYGLDLTWPIKAYATGLDRSVKILM